MQLIYLLILIFDKEIEKLSLVHFLMSVGYFSISGRYPYNNSIKRNLEGNGFL